MSFLAIFINIYITTLSCVQLKSIYFLYIIKETVKLQIKSPAFYFV